jgi:hypothetical protein
MQIKRVIVLGLVLFVPSIGAVPWTWLHTKRFDARELSSMRDKTQVSVAHSDTPAFTQLVLSFNARLPEKGYLSFSVQARSRNTGQWLETHHMLDWGAGISKSYDSIGGASSCHHVRLEVPRFARGYRVKIQAHDGAEVTSLRALSICLSDFSKFSDAVPALASLAPVVIDSVAAYSQMTIEHERAHHMCSPTSLSMLLSFLLEQPINPAHTAQAVYDTGLDAYGSWPMTVAHAYQFCQSKQPSERDWCYWAVTRMSSFTDLHAQLVRGIPVMVSVRGSIPGAAKVYPHGHLLLVIGYDARNRKVICHDPAFDHPDKVRVSYDVKPFIQAWGRSHNLAIIVDPIRA